MKHRSFRYEVQRSGALLAWLAAAGLVHAQEHTAHGQARLRLTTPGSCVTESGIAAGVHQRSDTIEFVARDDVPVLEVAVAEHERELQAVLSVRWPDGRSARRSLAGKSCQQLTAAMALLISMTLEPANEPANATKRAGPARAKPANQRGVMTPAPSPRSEKASSAEGDARDSPSPATRADGDEPAPIGAAADGGSSIPPQAPDSAPSPATAATAPNAPPSSTRADVTTPVADGGDGPDFFQLETWSVGAQGTLDFGAAPRALPGVGAYLWLAWHGAPPWSPALRLDFSHAWLDDYAAIGGKASFALTSASLELCPVALRGGPIAAHACASAQLGALSARGSDTYQPAAHTQLWSAFGVALLASVRVTSWAEAQLGAALRAPAQRDRFAFAPDVFHRVGWLSAELRVSLGVRFP